MKVLCIDATSFPDCLPCDIYEGDVYTVIDQRDSGLNIHGEDIPGVVYVLAERSSKDGYSCERFIPLSDLDETELVNDEYLDKIFEPVNK